MMLLPWLLACAPTGSESTGEGATDDLDSAGPVAYDEYSCGWEKRDPGTLESTGNEVGSVLANLELVDQCGETFRVWDMYAEYFILFVTAAW